MVIPTTNITAASAAPAMPSLRCTLTRRAATSPVCTTNSTTQAVNTAPWRWTSGLSGLPLMVAPAPPASHRR